MKKLIVINFMIVLLVFSSGALAKTNLSFDGGLVMGENIESDFIPGGKLRITTDLLNFGSVYDLVEFNSTFGIDAPNYNFVSSELLFCSKLDFLNSQRNYIGLGFKNLFLDNSLASDFIFSSDIEGYAFPLALKIKENYNNLDAFINASAFTGLYRMTVPGEDALASFNGASVDCGLQFAVSGLQMNLSYKQEFYKFKKDKDIYGTTDFDDGYKGVFLGLAFY